MALAESQCTWWLRFYNVLALCPDAPKARNHANLGACSSAPFMGSLALGITSAGIHIHHRAFPVKSLAGIAPAESPLPPLLQSVQGVCGQRIHREPKG